FQNKHAHLLLPRGSVPFPQVRSLASVHVGSRPGRLAEKSWQIPRAIPPRLFATTRHCSQAACTAMLRSNTSGNFYEPRFTASTLQLKRTLVGDNRRCRHKDSQVHAALHLCVQSDRAPARGTRKRHPATTSRLTNVPNLMIRE